MEEWLILLFITLLVTVKRESDHQKDLRKLYLNAEQDIEKEFASELDALQDESGRLNNGFLSIEHVYKAKEEKIEQLEAELQERIRRSENINRTISTMKLDILKWQKEIQVEQDKFNTAKQGSESVENEYNRHLNEKKELYRKIREHEVTVREKAHSNRKLRTKYDEAVFKILETKAKRILILEKLKSSENENDDLNKLIKEHIYQLKLISNTVYPQLEQAEIGFKKYWNPLIGSLKIESNLLETCILLDLEKYEAIKLDTLNVDKLKSVLDKFAAYKSKALEEISSRKNSYEHIVQDITASYDKTIQNIYLVVDHWITCLSSDNTSSSHRGSTRSPISYGINNDNSDTDSNELTTILKTNLFSNLNIRHLGSIINDSSFNPTSNNSLSLSNANYSTNDDSSDTRKRLDSQGNDRGSSHTSETSYSPSIENIEHFGVEDIEPLDYEFAITNPFYSPLNSNRNIHSADADIENDSDSEFEDVVSETTLRQVFNTHQFRHPPIFQGPLESSPAGLNNIHQYQSPNTRFSAQTYRSRSAGRHESYLGTESSTVQRYHDRFRHQQEKIVIDSNNTNTPYNRLGMNYKQPVDSPRGRSVSDKGKTEWSFEPISNSAQTIGQSGYHTNRNKRYSAMM